MFDSSESVSFNGNGLQDPRAGVILRPARLEDLPAIHQIDVESFSLPWPERSFRFELLDNPNASLWVAEVDGAVAGMIVVWLIVDEAHVATIAVLPGHRGLGLGRRLLAAGLLEAARKGAVLSYLEVRRSNVTAQALYQSFGFVFVGDRPRYYQDNHEDALLMTLQPLEIESLERKLSGEGR